ncbi:MAG: ATP-binding protein [Flavipsychrobacter sp.]
MKDTKLLLYVTTCCLSLLTALLILIIKKNKDNRGPIRQVEAGISSRQIPANSSLIEQEHIRTSISKELHDNIGQLLSLAQMNIYYLSKEISGEFRNNKVARDTISIIDQIHYSVQNISHNLNTDHVYKKDLDGLVKDELSVLKIAKGINTEFELYGERKTLNKDVKLAVFRVVQEALHNIVKHAYADGIIITQNNNPEFLKIDISDNGVGFNAKDIKEEDTNGLGLASMQQRVEAFGGYLHIASNDKGTTVSLTLPSIVAYEEHSFVNEAV